MRNLIKWSTFIAIAATTTGCTLTHPTDQATICAQLKRQLNYQTFNNNIEASWLSQKQHDALRQKLVDNNCDGQPQAVPAAAPASIKLTN